jgi:hypothetical protein
MRLFLEALLERHALDAISVIDEEGALVAAAARPACATLDLAWIGAIGSLLAVSAGSDREPRRQPMHAGQGLSALVDRATAGRQLDAREVMLRGERLCVASVGGALPATAFGAGMERILGHALPAIA